MHKVARFKKHLKLDYNKMKKQDKVNDDVKTMSKDMKKMNLDDSSDEESEKKPVIKRSIKPLKFKF
jgi:hypothetical protein